MNSRLFRIYALLLMTLFLIAACRRRNANIAPDVIVLVGERHVTLEDFKRYLMRNAGTDLAQTPPEASSALLDQFVEELLLSEHAAKTGIDVPTDKIAEAVRNDPGSTVVEKRDEMRRARLLGNLSASVPNPGENEIRAYYQQHEEEFRLDDRIRVRQILVSDEKLAEQIIKDLKGGAAFEDLSAKHSEAANAAQGGDIGYVGRGEIPKIFEDEIFNLKPGQISDIIRTDAKFHIFKVDDFKPAGPVDPATAEASIRARLQTDAQAQAVRRIVDSVRGQIPVTILTKRLPFAYSGSLSVSKDE